MIERNEVILLAKALSLSPDTIEKDYVLSWLLWGINQDEELNAHWYFKGGTSLKKCFFETFRFSEDLDFTLTNPAHLTADFFRQKFNQITDKIYDETGVEFFADKFRFKTIPKVAGKLSAEGVIHYNGPLRRRQGNSATVKLDLTDNEIVVLQPQRKLVDHPYSDEPTQGIWSNCYAFEEVVAEKIRALAERARPRDLYDVIHFFRNRDLIKNPQLVYNTLIKKCSYKKILVPTYLSMQQHEKLDELNSQWHNMLAHQLTLLPSLESFWQELEPFFAWLQGSLEESRIVKASYSDEEIFQPGRIRHGYSEIDKVIRTIQFAAASRVCVELNYHGKKRIVEPQSLKTAKSGNRIFYAYERGEVKVQIKAFSISEIENVTITNSPYTERDYPIEINASGTVSMPPITKKRINY